MKLTERERARFEKKRLARLEVLSIKLAILGALPPDSTIVGIIKALTELTSEYLSKL